jgi:enoyl-CoA hydratase
MIELTHRGDIAIVTLMHGKANALDIDFCDAIAAQFAVLRNAPAKAVVLTGQGRMFSAGVNLLKLSEGGAPYVRRFLPALHRLYEEVFFFPKPVVAAVNGHAIAGGCVLACCADRRIAARDGGRIGVTELLVGVPFPAMAFEVMRFATPPAFFAETLLSGATYLPEIAQARRLVDELADADVLLPRAIEAATVLAALSPPAFATTKQQLRQDARDRLAGDGAQTDKVATEIWTSDATLAFICDYVERTLKKA